MNEVKDTPSRPPSLPKESDSDNDDDGDYLYPSLLRANLDPPPIPSAASVIASSNVFSWASPAPSPNRFRHFRWPVPGDSCQDRQSCAWWGEKREDFQVFWCWKFNKLKLESIFFET